MYIWNSWNSKYDITLRKWMPCKALSCILVRLFSVANNFRAEKMRSTEAWGIGRASTTARPPQSKFLFFITKLPTGFLAEKLIQCSIWANDLSHEPNFVKFCEISNKMGKFAKFLIKSDPSPNLTLFWVI